MDKSKFRGDLLVISNRGRANLPCVSWPAAQHWALCSNAVRKPPGQHAHWLAATAIELLAPKIFLPDPELLELLRSCVPEQGILSMAEAQALLMRNFRVGGSKPSACAQWL